MSIAAGAAAAAAGCGLFMLFRRNRVVAAAATRDTLKSDGETPDAYSPAVDAASAAQCLSAAFFDDPLLRFLLPDDAQYRRESPILNQCMIWALHTSYGLCDVIRTATGEIAVVGLWEPASMTLAGGLRFMLIFVVLLYRLGPRMLLKFGGLMMTLESKRHRHAPTAHHLQALGTIPAHQGRGLGGKVIEVGIARATAAGVPAYLESSNPKNVPFYKRHGFEVVEEYFPFSNPADKGPVLTLMFRPIKAD